MYRSHVLVCAGTGCTSSNSDRSSRALKKRSRPRAWTRRPRSSAPAASACAPWAPSWSSTPRAPSTASVTPEDVPEIVSEHLVKGRIVKRLLYQETVEDGNATSLDETTFYKQADAHRPAQLRRHQPREHRRVHRRGRLRGPGQGPHRDDRPSRSSTRCWPPACGAAAAPASPPGGSGSSPRRRAPTARSTSAATPTRATPARSWTAPCWRATPTACWRPWPSPATPSAPTRATSTSAPSTPSRSSGCRSPSSRPGSTACWARTSSAPALTLTWSCAWAPAPSSAARRPP